MDIGNDSYFKCPSCKKKMYRTNWISYHVSGGKTFSDGVFTGMPHFTPNLAKCPHCGALSFLNNLKETEIERYSKADLRDDYTKRKKLEEPEIKDLVKAVKQGFAKTSKEEIELRTTIWIELNNKCRRGDYVFTKSEMALWEKNCKALLSLLIQDQGNAKKDTKEIDPNDEKNLNIQITIAELHRNLEHYDKCAEVIKTLPKEMKWLKDQYLKKCKAQNRFTFELKNKKPHESVSLSPRSASPRKGKGKKGHSRMIEL